MIHHYVFTSCSAVCFSHFWCLGPVQASSRLCVLHSVWKQQLCDCRKQQQLGFLHCCLLALTFKHAAGFLYLQTTRRSLARIMARVKRVFPTSWPGSVAQTMKEVYNQNQTSFHSKTNKKKNMRKWVIIVQRLEDVTYHWNFDMSLSTSGFNHNGSSRDLLLDGFSSGL